MLEDEVTNVVPIQRFPKYFPSKNKMMIRMLAYLSRKKFGTITLATQQKTPPFGGV